MIEFSSEQKIGGTMDYSYFVMRPNCKHFWVLMAGWQAKK